MKATTTEHTIQMYQKIQTKTTSVCLHIVTFYALVKTPEEKVLSIFVDNDIKEALLNLLEFTIQRKK